MHTRQNNFICVVWPTALRIAIYHSAFGDAGAAVPKAQPMALEDSVTVRAGVVIVRQWMARGGLRVPQRVPEVVCSPFDQQDDDRT